jgi:hypothetical protein
MFALHLVRSNHLPELGGVLAHIFVQDGGPWLEQADRFRARWHFFTTWHPPVSVP